MWALGALGPERKKERPWDGGVLAAKCKEEQGHEHLQRNIMPCPGKGTQLSGTWALGDWICVTGRNEGGTMLPVSQTLFLAFAHVTSVLPNAHTTVWDAYYDSIPVLPIMKLKDKDRQLYEHERFKAQQRVAVCVHCRRATAAFQWIWGGREIDSLLETMSVRTEREKWLKGYSQGIIAVAK